MMNQIISFAVERRWFVVIATLLIALLGVYNATKLPIDAVPDITNIQVQINTEADGYSPLEVEQRITYIVENAMSGIPNLDYTRSLSRYGLSQVTVIFEEGTDIYWARQQVNERISSVSDELPPGVKPIPGPIASGLGEIFIYSLSAKDDAVKPDGSRYTAEDLRTIQDWIIRPQLMTVKGVTEINSIGGYEREYQVTPFPGKLLAYKVTIKDLVNALEANNQNAGAGYIERNGEQWLVRSPGQLQSMQDIADLVVTKRDDAPVRIKDLAEVKIGKQLRTGAATQNGKETVLGTAFMLLGENSRTVAKAVFDKLEIVNQSLPSGVVAEAVYNRTTLVEKTIETVKTNLLEGAALVIAILFLLLGNIRAALITALVIPLSMLFAITGMAANRVSGNLMSLGAIDFGLIVDGAVIVVENALRRLSLAQQRLGRELTLQERLDEVKGSSLEVFRPAVFGVLIIMLVYAPIMVLTGVEGKMFQPMAFTVIAALLGALIFAITFVPAAVAIFVKGKVNDKENWMMLRLHRLYQPALKFALSHTLLIVSFALIIVSACIWQARNLGTEFLPQLDEHDVALHALRIPGTGLEQAIDMQMLLGEEIKQLPEVERVFAKIGMPEIATDPMPPSVADTFVILKPRAQWPDKKKTKAQFLQELRKVVEAIPGNKYEFTQPIEMRFNELIAGVRSDVAVRIYGDDMAILAEYGEKATGLLAQVAGGTDVRVEQTTGLPMLSIEPQRDHMALLGLSISDLQFAIRAAVGGLQTGLIFEGDRRFKLMLRMDESVRRDPTTIAQIPIALSAQANPEISYVPLGEVATIREI
ncbi:MAG: CusA/CzcA family heavy metal efflux RND transporter, partial [Kangiellaceae bacterium]|nr:CusA/CzcA family heavy metal efflux RND transporter [Kangiellaceae bacterium]